MRLARIVSRGSRVEIERDDAAARMKLDAEIRRPAEHAALLLACPEALGEGRTRVGIVGLGGDHPDRALRVVIADPPARGVTRHPASDDQVPVGRHQPAIVAASVVCARYRPARP
jgi:hypothetical protein